MVNPGHASNGCQTCRFRRIKCDNGYPKCLKCAKSKRVCLGYGSQKPISLHTNNLDAKTETQQTRLTPVWRSRNIFSLNQAPTDVQFVNEPVSISRGHAIPLGVCNLLNITSIDHAPCCAIWYAVEAVGAGFQALQEASQTVRSRRKLHAKYQSALHEFRTSLSSLSGSKTLYTAAYLFALYEVRIFTKRKIKTVC
jgi:hypothetical protein